MANQKTEFPEEVEKLKPPQDHQPALTNIDNNTEEPLLVFKPKPGTVIPARRRFFWFVMDFVGIDDDGPSPPSTSAAGVSSETHKAEASIQPKNSNKVLPNWSP
ncbi:unnamed protein product [Prunus brigantina]